MSLFISSPYQDSSINFIYNILFCDNLELYKTNTKPPYTYPFDILFSEASTIDGLQQLIDDPTSDPRIKVLAYNRQRALGHTPEQKELLAVIVEVGLDYGLDVLASFANGTARYLNQSGKILIWENENDPTANELTRQLFSQSRQIVEKIGPWDQPRRPHPQKGYARITFLVSDGLYFGEAPVSALFNDALAAPALTTAAQLVQFLTQKATEGPQP